MNNTKISVLAWLTLALCALGSVEATDTSTTTDDCDPIVGTWNVSILVPEALSFDRFFEGVVTFFKDGAVAWTTIPRNPVDAGVFATQSHGCWKRVGCDYRVVVASAQNLRIPVGVSRDSRWKTEATFNIINCCHVDDCCDNNCCKLATITTGTITEFDLSDLCLDNVLRTFNILRGDACIVCRPITDD